MSIADTLINVVIFILNSIFGILPVEVQGLSLYDFNIYIVNGIDKILSSFNFINNFFPVGLLFIMLGIILVAEIALHFGFKGIKYVINIFRGSGG